MTPIQLLTSARKATEPAEKRRLLRECLNALPLPLKDAGEWERERRACAQLGIPIDDTIRDAIICLKSGRADYARGVPGKLAAALAQLPGTLDEDAIDTALFGIATTVRDLVRLPRNTNEVGSSIWIALKNIGCEMPVPADRTLSDRESLDLLPILCRAGAALADTRDAIKRGESIGAALLAEAHLRQALALAAGSDR